MAYSNINKPNEYFNTKLHTGTGAEATITGVGFQPDLVWSKSRSNVESNTLIDVVRGAGNALTTNTTSAEATGETQMLKSFNSDGFVVGFNGQWNASGYTYVYWNWLAGGTGVSNTNGSITSTVSANTDSGFSIVTWSGNNGTNATVGHSLGVAPSLIITKNRSGASDWPTYHSGLSSGYTIFLNTTGAQSNAASWYGTNAPTSSVFYTTYVGNISINASSNNYVSYCFAEKKGFSKFGKYTGNGSADGTFIYTGFKPAFWLVKRTDTATNWFLKDSAREPFNQVDANLYPNTNVVESDGNGVDFTSNGVKNRDGGVSTNASGGTYIYMAFAESPLVAGNYVPTTAR